MAAQKNQFHFFDYLLIAKLKCKMDKFLCAVLSKQV